jgi:hypothetical protein
MRTRLISLLYYQQCLSRRGDFLRLMPQEPILNFIFCALMQGESVLSEQCWARQHKAKLKEAILDFPSNTATPKHSS